MDVLRRKEMGSEINLSGGNLQISPHSMGISSTRHDSRTTSGKETMMRADFSNRRVAVTNRLRDSCSSLGSNRATPEMTRLSVVLLALILAAAGSQILCAQEAVSTTGTSGTTTS